MSLLETSSFLFFLRDSYSSDNNKHSARQPPKNENCKAATAAWTAYMYPSRLLLSRYRSAIIFTSQVAIYVAACKQNQFKSACACKLICKLLIQVKVACNVACEI